MKRSARTIEEGDIELSIPLETVCFIIFKAREFDAEDEVTEPDPGSNPSDDRETAVLEDHADDPAEEELRSLISDLSLDEQIDLVALMWTGRDDRSADEWEAVRQEAADAHNARTADYLCGSPLLADHLADGLSTLGYSCADYERDHL